MKKCYILLGALLISMSTIVLADDVAAINTWPPLNKVTYQVTDEAWASSQTVDATVSIDASLNQAKLDNVHRDIQAKLAKLAPNANWHITTFERVKNDSGLEQVHAEASARLATTHIGDIRASAKKISTPGETFSIKSLDYSPSNKEVEKVHADLRNRIYAQTKAELARLNKLYPRQQYYLHEINFNAVLAAPMPRMMMATATRNKQNSNGGDSALSMSQRITETAIVVLAAKPGEID